MRGRATPVLALGLVVVAVLGPSLRDPPRDSYPLSTYPMFSHDRGRMSSVATAVGVTAAGRVVRLSPRLIGGSDEVMLAVQTVANAVRRGPEAAADLCRRVAARVADSDRDVVASVRVAVETHDAVAYFSDDRRAPVRTDVVARCAVER